MLKKNVRLFLETAACLTGAAALLSCGAAATPPPPPTTETQDTGTPESGQPDLTVGALTTSPSLAEGTGTTASLVIKNAGNAAAAQPFSVKVFLCPTSSFQPASDTVVGTASVASGPGAGASMSVDVPLTIPTLGINQAVYLYAQVDSDAAVAEVNETNNVSAPADAAVILVYQGSDQARTYPVLLDTWAPAGTGTVDAILGLYQDVSGTGTLVQAAGYGGKSGWASIDTTSAPLGPGTYYILVTAWDDGPYALSVRTAGIDHPAGLAALTSNGEDPGEMDNTPRFWPVNQNMPSLPPAFTPLCVGATANRYVDNTNGDYDWFRFTLP